LVIHTCFFIIIKLLHFQIIQLSNHKIIFTPMSNIIITGAKVHNLKNINVSIPTNKLVVVTGVSGSGKSSLTMDTLFAEGQRRYVESLSSYARQFMKTMDKPNVDNIEGLCPAIAIEQKVTSRTPRSTVGSMTEINDYLRLLFAKIGKTFSPISNKQVMKHEVNDVVTFINNQKKGAKIQVLAYIGQESIDKNYLENILHNGYTRLYDKQNNHIIDVQEAIENNLTNITTVKNKTKTNAIDKHNANYYLLIDRIIIKDFDTDELHRISDSVQTAFEETNGDVHIELDGDTMHHFCNRFEMDGIAFEEPSPNLFSSNNPYGACATCEGFGTVIGTDMDLVIPNKSLSLYEDAVACWKGETMSMYKNIFITNSKKYAFPIHKPIKELSKEHYNLLLNGDGENLDGVHAFFNMVAQNLYKIQYRVLQSRYRGKAICPTCNGDRLRAEALFVKVTDTTIAKLNEMPAKELQAWLKSLKISADDSLIAKRILLELNTRLDTLVDVGLGYLSMMRTANTLSGGESQRIQLTRVIGSNLSDSLYILDEPSIGLHARDTHNLIRVLQELKSLDNTVLIVEHDEQIMREADYIIDMGPLASIHGGEVIAAGDYTSLIKNKNSLTGKYLSGALKVTAPISNRKLSNKIILTGCAQHNLQNIDISIPLNCLCVISGVSGSGKTTFVKHILYPALRNALGDLTIKPGLFDKLSGDFKQLTGVEMIDQNPIGKSSRSNPVTYIKAYDEIRDLFANQYLSKTRGYKASHFSFNVDGGRCDTCKGEGETIIEMQFLADVRMLCESCKGNRFKEEVLEVTYREKNISDVLQMSVDEAIILFVDEKKIIEKMNSLASVGLGYVSLGQSSDTLSGGEAQRVKLASFMDKSFNKDKILFIFDEPTTGLHFHDINKLLASFNALIEKGHSIVVIEHNADIINNADWVIDLGPEAGENGGNLVYAGNVIGLKKCKESWTGKYL
jgi:excinuclease ABC subunit A